MPVDSLETYGIHRVRSSAGGGYSAGIVGWRIPALQSVEGPLLCANKTPT